MVEESQSQPAVVTAMWQTYRVCLLAVVSLWQWVWLWALPTGTWMGQ